MIIIFTGNAGGKSTQFTAPELKQTSSSITPSISPTPSATPASSVSPSPQTTIAPSPVLSAGNTTAAVHTDKGDTMDITIDGKKETVRLLLVDTPEITT